MIQKSILAPDATCRLLWAAALLDAVLVFVLLLLFGPLLGALVTMIVPAIGTTRSMAPEILAALQFLIGAIGYLILLLIYWLVTELLLGGKTVGRMCLMMDLRQSDGRRPRTAQLSKRGLRKLATCGLSGTAVKGLDSHDRNNGLVWRSPLAAGNLSATRNWKIAINSGQYAGSSHVLDRLPGYLKRRYVRIGRDPKWSDIVLDREERVSSQHAVIRLGKKGWQITDYGGGRGSSNKTFVNGQSVPFGTWVTVRPNDKIRVANVELRLET